MIDPKISNDWLYWRAKATPHKTALLFGTKRWNFAELDVLTNRMVSWLLTLEIPANKRMGLLMQNRPEYVLLIYAASRLGVTLVTFNTRLTAAEVKWQIEFTGCGLVLVDEVNGGKVDEEDDRCVCIVPGIDEIGNWQFVHSRSADEQSDMQAIVFTSGTTGRPKAVPVTYQQHFLVRWGRATD